MEAEPCTQNFIHHHDIPLQEGTKEQFVLGKSRSGTGFFYIYLLIPQSTVLFITDDMRRAGHLDLLQFARGENKSKHIVYKQIASFH